MAMIETPRTAPFGAITTFRAVNFILSTTEPLTASLRSWIEARRTAQELARLSPAPLQDIGMTEADVDRYRMRAGL